MVCTILVKSLLYDVSNSAKPPVNLQPFNNTKFSCSTDVLTRSKHLPKLKLS